MEQILYKIAIFQMYTLIILAVCLLFSNGRKISRGVALAGYLFISMVAFGAYTSQAVAQSAGDNSTVIYVGCAVAVALPVLFATKAGRDMTSNVVASFIYDVIKFFSRSFSAILGKLFRRGR